MTKEISKARALLLGTTVTLVTLIVASLVAEFAVRYRERHRDEIPDAQTTMYYRTNYLPHALVRDFDYFGWVSINRYGFRGDDIAVPKPDGVFRIMTVGASTTFDTSVSPDDAAWPERLEHWLGQRVPGLRVEVINAGVSGYKVVDNIVRLQTELYRYEPDLIVLFHSHNDLGAALGAPVSPADPRRPNELETSTPWGHWLEKHSLFYNKLKLRAVVVRRGIAANRSLARADEIRWDERLSGGTVKYEQDLRIFVATAEALGIPVVLPSVVTVSGDRVPTEEQPEEVAAWARTTGAPPAVILEGYESFREATRRVAEERGVPYIDTGAFGLVGWEYFSPGDPVHFNRDGAERMGRLLAEAIVAAGAVPDVPAAPEGGAGGSE